MMVYKAFLIHSKKENKNMNLGNKSFLTLNSKVNLLHHSLVSKTVQPNSE